MFDKIVKWAREDIDKICHYLVCTLISLLITLTLGLIFGITLWISALVGIVIGVIIGVLKENYDSKHEGIFDLEDLLADIAGSASGALIGTIFILLT